MLPASVHPAALLGPLIQILLAPFNPVALFISLQVRVLPAPVCPSRLRVRALQAPFGLAAAQGHAGAQFALGSGMSMTRRPSSHTSMAEGAMMSQMPTTTRARKESANLIALRFSHEARE